MRRLLFSVLVILTSLPLLATAQSNPSPSIVRVPDTDSLRSWMRRAHVPAVAIGIIENGRVSGVYLFGESRSGVPVTTTSLFNVASLTKPVTAVTTLRLISAGQLELNESFDPYWVDPDIRDDSRHSKLTPRVILSHQTGFPNWRRIMPDKKLGFIADPGTKVTYSGAGYDYLRQALEHKFKRTLNQLADSILFSPLAMRETTFGWDVRKDSARFVVPHDTNGVAIPTEKLTMDNANAADWLVTAIGDYTAFAAYALNGAGLAADVRAAMITPQIQFDGKPNEAMGLGWEVMKGPAGDDPIVLHTGSDPGIKTMVVLLPTSRRGLVMFTNGERGMDVILKILKASLDLKQLTP